MSSNFRYGSERLSVGKCLDLASGKLTGSIDAKAREKIKTSRSYVDQIVNSHRSVYGVNTGFGPLCDTRISEEDTIILQSNILQSHSVGVGKPVPEQIARIMMITKVHALSQGYSGVCIETLERILLFLDKGVTPIVPEKGSVGASGDLAPLSHLFLPLIGMGKVFYLGETLSGSDCLQRLGIEPLVLGPKEGLALINGTQFILAFAVSGLQRMHKVLETADISGALSLEGLMGSAQPFDSRLHDLRPFAGSQLVAHRLRALLGHSEILASHIDCDRVQDPYSLRCMPQVHGASRNAWLHLKELTEIELNAVTDNPILFGADDTISGGNFHGQPLALPLDYATFASAEIGNIADRRCYLMIEGRYGLPKLLIQDAGLNSGFMIPQYTSAALVTENKTFCFPASADSIPTSLGQEDHVSMGSISGRKLHMVLDNLEYILAIEILYACQAIDFRRPMKSSVILEACHDLIRAHVHFATKDRVFSLDIETLKSLVTSGLLPELVSETAIKNNLDLSQTRYECFKLY